MRPFVIVFSSALLLSCGSGALVPDDEPSSAYGVEEGWPVIPDGVAFGKPLGVAVDSRGRVYVTHTADKGSGNAENAAEGASAEGLSSKGREKGSRVANALARRLTGSELSDAMSGFFLLRSAQLRSQADRLSGIGFKIMLDILATAEPPLRVKEFPLKFAQRASGESKLDHGVVLDFLAGLYERWLGRFIPTRFALFGTVGALGVVVHMAVLTPLYKLLHMPFTASQAAAGAFFCNVLSSNSASIGLVRKS